MGKKIVFICKRCGNEYGNTFKDFSEIPKCEDLHGKRITWYCKNCIEDRQKELQESAFVEEYNGHNIYINELGGYHPYWGSHYYFTTLKDCRARIDNKTCAVVSVGMFGHMNSIMK